MGFIAERRVVLKNARAIRAGSDLLIRQYILRDCA